MNKFATAIMAGCVLGASAFADVVSDWNTEACAIVFEAEAVKETTNASPEAAVAAANRAALTALLPSQKEAIDRAYQKALASIPDGASAAESYRPLTAAGIYVPTTIPAVPQWPQRKPWMLTSPSQFRPGPPPALGSARWARDYDEVKTLGAKNGSTRTAEQTEIARFWEATFPSVYYGVVRSVADQSGRDVARNARVYAAVAQGIDDAIVAVFDARYQYGFWGPITAIRNGDEDGNDATERDPSWSPLIETPMHPEYPCAHSILSATVGTILQADIGDGPVPTLTATNYAVNGAAMGRQVGGLAARKHFGPP